MNHHILIVVMEALLKGFFALEFLENIEEMFARYYMHVSSRLSNLLQHSMV